MTDLPWYLCDEHDERWQRHVRLVHDFREWLIGEGLIKPRAVDVSTLERSELDELI
jgi:hypothetical protein